MLLLEKHLVIHLICTYLIRVPNLTLAHLHTSSVLYLKDGTHTTPFNGGGGFSDRLIAAIEESETEDVLRVNVSRVDDIIRGCRQK